MSFTISGFRQDFPEFNDSVKYPDAQVTFWSTIAIAMVNPCVWKSLTNQGIELYTAHELTIAAQSQQAASIGGTPGVSGGIKNAKTVGSASVGYDAASTTEKDAGWWNQTTYGKQFIRLARIFGAGGVILGASPYGRGPGSIGGCL